MHNWFNIPVPLPVRYQSRGDGGSRRSRGVESSSKHVGRPAGKSAGHQAEVRWPAEATAEARSVALDSREKPRDEHWWRPYRKPTQVG